MRTFSDYLDTVEKLIREKKYDKAWEAANEGLLGLMQAENESWYMMYYQMAIILAREKKWFQALEKMGFMVHYLGQLGGATHKKFVLRLLKKYGKEDIEGYVSLAVSKEPKDLASALEDFLKHTQFLGGDSAGRKNGGERMALTKCDECGREISTKAGTCPNCGAPQSQAVDREELRRFVEARTATAEKRAVKEPKKPRSFKFGCVVGLLIGIVVGITLWSVMPVNKYIFPTINKYFFSNTSSKEKKIENQVYSPKGKILNYEEAIIGRWNSMDAFGGFIEFFDDGKCVIEGMPLSLVFGGLPGTYEIKGKMLNLELVNPISSLSFSTSSTYESKPLKASLEILMIGPQKMVLGGSGTEGESTWRRQTIWEAP